MKQSPAECLEEVRAEVERLLPDAIPERAFTVTTGDGGIVGSVVVRWNHPDGRVCAATWSPLARWLAEGECADLAAAFVRYVVHVYPQIERGELSE